MNKTGSVFGGSLIVAGTTIGAGMLAMPLVTAAGGFLAAAAIYTVCCALMILAGLIMLEVHMWTGVRSNLVSMSEQFLGPFGKWCSILLYVFLFYVLCVAYVAGGGGLLASYLALPPALGAPIFVFILFLFLGRGAAAVDRANRWLMLALFLSYGLFLVFGVNYIQVDRLLEGTPSRALLAMPLIFTTFSFQGTVPSLADYLGGDVAKTRRSIIWGCITALVVYLLWQALVLGIAPKEGAGGLFEALSQGKTAVYALEHTLQRSSLMTLGSIFALSAIATSFLGVNLGLVDFIADGLCLRRRAWALFLALFPPLILTWIYPSIFISALSVAGGVGCVLLLGVLPLCMLVSGLRRGFKVQEPFLKNRLLLTVFGAALLTVFVIEMISLAGI